MLLAPCDMIQEVKIVLGEQYQKSIEEARTFVSQKKENKLIDFPVFANGKISAKTFYNDFIPNSKCDFFKYREKLSKSTILNKISIPVLVIYGDHDECVLTQTKEDVNHYLQSNFINSKIEIIKDTNRSFEGKEKELQNVIMKSM